MERRATWVAALACAAGLPAQDPERVAQRDARRFVTFLELPSKRPAAAEALLKLGAAAIPALIRGMNHPRHDVACTCVHVLGFLGSGARSAIPAMKKLARSKDPVLAHAGRWGIGEIVDHGLTIAAEINKDRILVFDAKGKQVHDIAVGRQIYDAHRLSSGRYLVCLLREGRVVEMDAKGKILWETTECKNPLDAERLPNGNTIIAGGNKKRVVEVDRDGKLVWEWKGTNWPNDVDRLPNGNTLVADSPARQIFEVAPDGEVVWSYRTGGGVIDAQRLPNGDTMFVRSQSKGVAIVSRKGEIVWEHKKEKAQCAFRCPDGSTWIAGSDLVALDPQGKELWRAKRLGQIKAVQRH